MKKIIAVPGALVLALGCTVQNKNRDMDNNVLAYEYYQVVIN